MGITAILKEVTKTAVRELDKSFDNILGDYSFLPKSYIVDSIFSTGLLFRDSEIILYVRQG